MHADAVIEQLAAGQHGVVTRAQIASAGLSGRSVDRRLAEGRLCSVHRGIYRVGPIEAPRAREMAAVLACGSDAVLSHRTAGRLWGCIPAGTADGLVEVTLPRPQRRRVDGILAHRSRSLAGPDVSYRESLPVTVAARTLLDLATVLPLAEMERALARAERDGLVRAGEVWERARACPRHPGAALMRTLLEVVKTPEYTRSEAEARMLELIRRGRLGRPKANTLLHGYEVDFLWSAERLVVEVDGFAYHSSARAFASDRRRDAALTAAGFHIVRVTWNDITKHPEATLVNLAQALGLARR